MSLEDKLEAVAKQLARIADHLDDQVERELADDGAIYQLATPSVPHIGKDVEVPEPKVVKKVGATPKKAAVEDEQAPVAFEDLHRLFHRTLVQIKAVKGLPTAKIVCKKFLTKFTKDAAPLTADALPVEKYNEAYEEVLNVRKQHGITES